MEKIHKEVLAIIDGILLAEAIDSLDNNEPVNGLGYARELIEKTTKEK